MTKGQLRGAALGIGLSLPFDIYIIGSLKGTTLNTAFMIFKVAVAITLLVGARRRRREQ